LAAEHRRLYEVSMAIAVVFIAVVQAWAAFVGLGAPFAERGLFLRLILVFCGVFAVVYGNFHAKAAPPSGASAPAPEVWIRGMLRNGWAMVLLGFPEVALAIFVPLRLLPIYAGAMLAVTLLILRSELRLTWPSRKLPARV